MALLFGPHLHPVTPRDAVAAAFAAAGLSPDDVLVEPLDEDIAAWSWKLADNAPPLRDEQVVLMAGVLDADGGWRPTSSARHPAIRSGLVIDTECGWVVAVADQGETDDDLMQAIREHIDMLEANG